MLALVRLGSIDGNCFWIEGKLWITRIHFLQGSQNQIGDEKIARPFVIRRHNMPRRAIGRAAVDRILVGLLIIVPERALLDIVGIKLPPFLGIMAQICARRACEHGCKRASDNRC